MVPRGVGASPGLMGDPRSSDSSADSRLCKPGPVSAAPGVLLGAQAPSRCRQTPKLYSGSPGLDLCHLPLLSLVLPKHWKVTLSPVS